MNRGASTRPSATQPSTKQASGSADQEVDMRASSPAVPTTPRITAASGGAQTSASSATPSSRTTSRGRSGASSATAATNPNPQSRYDLRAREQRARGTPSNPSSREVAVPPGVAVDNTRQVATSNTPRTPRALVGAAISPQFPGRAGHGSTPKMAYNQHFPSIASVMYETPDLFPTYRIPSAFAERMAYDSSPRQNISSPLGADRYLRTMQPSDDSSPPCLPSSPSLPRYYTPGRLPVTPTDPRTLPAGLGSDTIPAAGFSSRASSGGRDSLPTVTGGSMPANPLSDPFALSPLNVPGQGTFYHGPRIQQHLPNGPVARNHAIILGSRVPEPHMAQHYTPIPRPGVRVMFREDVTRQGISATGGSRPSSTPREIGYAVSSPYPSTPGGAVSIASGSHLYSPGEVGPIASEVPNSSVGDQGPRAGQLVPERTMLPSYQWTRQPNPNSNSLGAVDPDGAALFLDVFDEALGIPSRKKSRFSTRKGGLSPGYGSTGQLRPTHNPLSGVDSCGASLFLDASSDFSHRIKVESSHPSKQDMASAFEVAHERPLPPLAPQTEPWQDEIEEQADFKEYLANMIGKMMYVSGETGEPSAETTGMIEEIVRQQVIEMVSTR